MTRRRGDGREDRRQRLMDEAHLLRKRLHRVMVALALTEDLIADTFGTLADTSNPRSTSQRLEAKRARAAAEACRTFADRLKELSPGFVSVHVAPDIPSEMSGLPAGLDAGASPDGAPVHVIDGDGASLCELVPAGKLLRADDGRWDAVPPERRCRPCQLLMTSYGMGHF